MQSPSSSSNGEPDHRQYACTSCKTRKKRCDKSLPKCSSCSRRGWTCEYLTPGQARPLPTDPSSNRPWQDASATSHHLSSNQTLDFSTLLFLDPAILQSGQIGFPWAPALAPAYVVDLLGSMDEMRATAARFFECIHPWMPFISKKRFYDIHLSSSLDRLSPEIALLLLSLKLITTLPPKCPRNPRTALYHTAKHYYMEVEASRDACVPVLQAGILIALYELGHAIYPAAYLSIGACARYAYALGIGVSKMAAIRQVLTLVEMEERRRVWWAIVILDRFVSIGCPGRPFATVEPRLDDLLPADDAEWDQGIVRPEDAVTLSSPRLAHMSKFALLCQSARLLGQVLEQVANTSSTNATQRDAEVWIQLDRTIQSMLDASLEPVDFDDNQIGFVYSSLVALYTPWLRPQSDATSSNEPVSERFQRANDVIQQITERIIVNALGNRCAINQNVDEMSPWGLFFAYHLSATHNRYGTSLSGAAEGMKRVKERFLEIDERWNAAGVYLQLLEAQQVMKGV